MRRQLAQTSLCRVAPEDSVNFSMPLLEIYVHCHDKILCCLCYRKLLAYVLLSVLVSRISLLYLGRERPP